jgi:hypothetical protein
LLEREQQFRRSLNLVDDCSIEPTDEGYGIILGGGERRLTV